MDLSPIILLIPTLIETGKSIIEIAKPFIKGNGFELPQDLENKIIELEHSKNANEIIALLKDFAKNCNSQIITQTNSGQGAVNVAGGNNTTINQSFAAQKQISPDIKLFNEISTDFSDDFVHFIQKHNFGRSFKDKDTYALSNLLDKYDNPKYSFINNTLKDKFGMLFDSIKKFAGYLCLNTFDLGKGRQGVDSIVKLLVLNGANKNAKNNKGQTPFDLAKDSNIKAYLKKSQ